MTGRGRMLWRVAVVAVATLAVMAGCSTGTPAPDRPASERGGGSATTAAPLPAAVTLPPAPSGRPAAGAFFERARRRWSVETRVRGVVRIHRLVSRSAQQLRRPP